VIKGDESEKFQLLDDEGIQQLRSDIFLPLRCYTSSGKWCNPPSYTCVGDCGRVRGHVCVACAIRNNKK